MQASPWKVVQVIANHEKRVAQHLTVRGLEHYLPLYTERSRWSDRTVELERPLFAGYVFVRYALESRRWVISTPGILRVLGDGGSETVSVEEIARIREGLASGCLLRPHPDVEVGTAVRVRSGVFEGVVGMVSEFRRSCRVVITLSAIRQCFSVEVDLQDIEVVGKTAHGIEKRLESRTPAVQVA